MKSRCARWGIDECLQVDGGLVSVCRQTSVFKCQWKKQRNGGDDGVLNEIMDIINFHEGHVGS